MADDKVTVFDLFQEKKEFEIVDLAENTIKGYFVKPTLRQHQLADDYYQKTRLHQRESAEYERGERRLEDLDDEAIIEQMIAVGIALFAEHTRYLVGMTEEEAEEIPPEKMLETYREHKRKDFKTWERPRLIRVAAAMLVDFKLLAKAMNLFFMKCMALTAYAADGSLLFSADEDNPRYIDAAHPTLIEQLSEIYQEFLKTEREAIIADLASDINFLPLIVSLRSTGDASPGSTSET